jgi:hypothetical protein
MPSVAKMSPEQLAALVLALPKEQQQLIEKAKTDAIAAAKAKAEAKAAKTAKTAKPLTPEQLQKLAVQQALVAAGLAKPRSSPEPINRYKGMDYPISKLTSHCGLAEDAELHGPYFSGLGAAKSQFYIKWKVATDADTVVAKPFAIVCRSGNTQTVVPLTGDAADCAIDVKRMGRVSKAYYNKWIDEAKPTWADNARGGKKGVMPKHSGGSAQTYASHIFVPALNKCLSKVEEFKKAAADYEEERSKASSGGKSEPIADAEADETEESEDEESEAEESEAEPEPEPEPVPVPVPPRRRINIKKTAIRDE